MAPTDLPDLLSVHPGEEVAVPHVLPGVTGKVKVGVAHTAHEIRGELVHLL